MDPLELLTALPTDTGRPWGAIATDWQRQDAEAILKPGDGPLLFWIERPKGASKSTDLAYMSIVWVLNEAGPLEEGYVVAADQDQANRLLNRARFVARKVPKMREMLKVTGEGIEARRTGAFVHSVASDVAGSEGILSRWLLVDELARRGTAAGPRELWTSIFSGIGKLPNSRLVVLGHAGSPGHWSYKIREHARQSPNWRFSTIPGPTPWYDPVALEEQRALLLPFEWQQRHENTWGALVKLLDLDAQTDSDLEADLIEALRLRNHLAHSFWRKSAEDFLTDAGRARMIAYLIETRKHFEDVDQRLTTTLGVTALQQWGVTPDVVDAWYRDMLGRVERGESSVPLSTLDSLRESLLDLATQPTS